MLNLKVEEGLRATERVACSGSESALDECVIEGMGEGGSCKLEEDIVSISCVPDSWATCEVRSKCKNLRKAASHWSQYTVDTILSDTGKSRIFSPYLPWLSSLVPTP